MALDHSRQQNVTQIRQAILKTLVYADLFDFPLSPEEVVRYLTVPASSETVNRVLDHDSADGTIRRSNGLLTLPGRTELIPLRERREDIARDKWVVVERYGRWIARLPFVRMIAVTGTLAVRNTEAVDDIDLLIVTAPDRLWLCRALVILVVRAAALAGDEICPNYFLSERELSLQDRDFFSAREVAQMVPVYGAQTYTRLRALNHWVHDFLPHAQGTSNGAAIMRLAPRERKVKQVMERMLSGRLGRSIEAWERERKIRKFERQAQIEGGSVMFTPDCCKGHFDHHDEVIMELFHERLAKYGLSGETPHG